MKTKIVIASIALLFNITHSSAAENMTIISPSSQAADGLNLQAVSELFTQTQNLEDFEKAINDPDEGLNNLDLDGNGEVDYIRVLEEVQGNTHLIVLQAALGKDEFQDVATIEVEKIADDYNMQIHGNEIIYGANYYYAPPTRVHIYSWPIISWIYRPVYRTYQSRFYFGYYPRWWRPFHPLHRTHYHTRIIKYTKRNTFVIAKTSRVKSATRVHYKPRHSTRVTKRVTVKRKVNVNGKTTTAKTKKTVKSKNTKTTVKKGKKTTKKNGEIKIVKKTKVTKKKRH